MEKSFVPVFCILLYMSLSVIGLMTIPWTMSAELFPLEIRGLAQGTIVSLAHIIMFSALQVRKVHLFIYFYYLDKEKYCDHEKLSYMISHRKYSFEVLEGLKDGTS